jgi:hypothetical protein
MEDSGWLSEHGIGEVLRRGGSLVFIFICSSFMT